MSCVGSSCVLLSCVVSCASVHAYVYVLCLCVRCGYTSLQFTVRADGDVGPCTDAWHIAFCRKGMLVKKATHCIRSAQNTNVYNQWCVRHDVYQVKASYTKVMLL